MLANVGIKKYVGSKVIKIVFALDTIDLAATSITKNNPEATPKKRYKVSTRFSLKFLSDNGKVTVRKKARLWIEMLRNVEVRC